MLTCSVLKVCLSDQILLVLLRFNQIVLSWISLFLGWIDFEYWRLLVDIIINRHISSLWWQSDHVGICLIAEDEALAHQKCLLADHRSLLNACDATVLTTREGSRWRGDSHLLWKLAGLERAHWRGLALIFSCAWVFLRRWMVIGLLLLIHYESVADQWSPVLVAIFDAPRLHLDWHLSSVFHHKSFARGWSLTQVFISIGRCWLFWGRGLVLVVASIWPEIVFLPLVVIL